MFETTVVESKRTRVRAARLALVPVSLTIHTLVIVGAIVGALANVSFPLNTPAQIESLRPAMAAPLPPPGPAPAPVRTEAAQSSPVAAAVRDMAPSVIPDEVHPAALPAGSPVADADAIEGGIPGSTGSSLIGDPNSVSSAPPDDVKPMVVGGEVKPPVVLSRIDPVYPNALRILRREGSVVVQ